MINMENTIDWLGSRLDRGMDIVARISVTDASIFMVGWRVRRLYMTFEMMQMTNRMKDIHRRIQHQLVSSDEDRAYMKETAIKLADVLDRANRVKTGAERLQRLRNSRIDRMYLSHLCNLIEETEDASETAALASSIAFSNLVEEEIERAKSASSASN